MPPRRQGGRDLERTTDPHRVMPNTFTIVTKFPDNCAICRLRVATGTKVYSARVGDTWRVSHLRCGMSKP